MDREKGLGESMTEWRGGHSQLTKSDLPTPTDYVRHVHS